MASWGERIWLPPILHIISDIAQFPHRGSIGRGFLVSVQGNVPKHPRRPQRLLPGHIPQWSKAPKGGMEIGPIISVASCTHCVVPPSWRGSAASLSVSVCLSNKRSPCSKLFTAKQQQRQRTSQQASCWPKAPSAFWSLFPILCVANKKRRLSKGAVLTWT